jgi:hypothetical protein
MCGGMRNDDVRGTAVDRGKGCGESTASLYHRTASPCVGVSFWDVVRQHPYTASSCVRVIIRDVVYCVVTLLCIIVAHR